MLVLVKLKMINFDTTTCFICTLHFGQRQLQTKPQVTETPAMECGVLYINDYRSYRRIEDALVCRVYLREARLELSVTSERADKTELLTLITADA